VFAALVVACFAAFLITQRLKHTPTAVQEFRLAAHFSPYTHPGHREAISFKLARADEVTVTVFDVTSGDTVATLLIDHPVVRYKEFKLSWNGRRGVAHGYEQLTSPRGRAIVAPENRGPLATAGEYRVRVSLREQHQTVSSPYSFTLEGR
jgi:hypothetical protein